MTGNSEKKIKVFVYGTLKTGEPNHKVLSETDGDYTFISAGTTMEKFPLVVGTKYNIPFLLDQSGTGNEIRGELYEVCEKKLAVLDELEAYPTLYDRKQVEIKLDKDSSITNAFIYLLKSWRPDLLATSSAMMSNYSSLGSHGRPYVDRYVRAKEMLDDATDGFNLYHEILGAENPVYIKLSQRKAEFDLKSRT